MYDRRVEVVFQSGFPNTDDIAREHCKSLELLDSCYVASRIG